jgi:hypothetical protein
MAEIAKLLRAIEHDDLEGFVSVGRVTEDGPDMVCCERGYHKVSDITPDLLQVVTRFTEKEADLIRQEVHAGKLIPVKCERLIPFRHFVGWLAKELGGSIECKVAIRTA